MSSETVRVWLVERGYNNRDLVILKYATLEGDRVYRRELAPQALDMSSVTAAEEVSTDDLEAVEETATRERYANEATRMAENHDPEDTV
ncbi:hypothetical protein SAMN04487948_10796 [Halogranum amylolyticum]|uniref:DUF7967 domain-containing protein n=1 Tax=Halogranum amylolyticum TaxID=660520 RepID=A0A1H8TJD9_9EURY|nr:hypothetical protein [Halogranum amylolyticum]SEO90916.1 hypothetical protein SAMN04487948_10796 [Halogranum amylolyticum]